MDDLFLKWSGFIGNTPLYQAKLKQFTTHKFYFIAVNTLRTLLFFGVFVKSPSNPVDLFLHILIKASMTVSLVHTALKVLQLNLNADLLKNLFAVDLMSSTTKHSKFWFVLSNLAIASYLPRVVISWGYSWTIIPFHISNFTFYYCYHYLAAVQVYLLHQIELRLKQLNKSLEKTATFQKLYNNLYYATSSFNDLFGSSIFQRFFIYIASFTFDIYVILSERRFTSGSTKLVIILSTSALKLVELFWLTKKSEDILGQVDLALKAVSFMEVEANEDRLSRKLFSLKQDLLLKRPVVKAAGVFDVNYGTLFMLYNLIITYMIVVVQALKEN